jgi:hypothetical protein
MMLRAVRNVAYFLVLGGALSCTGLRAEILPNYYAEVDLDINHEKRESLHSLAKEAVSISYHFYEPKYEMIIRHELQRLAVVGEVYSPEAQIMITIYVELFAEAIINQLSLLTPELRRDERSIFWDMAGEEIKLILVEFCTFFPVKVEVPADYIDNHIKLKKLFG